MIWGLILSIVSAIVFLFLFIRSAIANGNLRNQNMELQKNVDVKQKQLEIAANHPDTPADLAKRMRDGAL